MASCEFDWWRAASGSRSPAEKEWGKIPPHVRGDFLRLMERWEQEDLQPVGGDCARLGQWDVFYLRVRRGNNHFRLYFQMRGAYAVVLHVCYKNQQQIDKVTMRLIEERAKNGERL